METERPVAGVMHISADKGMTKSFSQNGEDVLLWEFFGRKASGFYIDVGAFDGKHLSNTYLFELAGWRGVCVEAHPFYFEKCKENRPKSMCVHGACVANEGARQVRFYSEELGLLSGVERRDEEDARRRYERRGLRFRGFEETLVPATTLSALLGGLEDRPEIDFISIDVEGSELDVLRGLDLALYRPRVLLVEATDYGAERNIDNHVMARGGYYKARRVIENMLYCRDEADVERMESTTVQFVPTMSMHPLGARYNPRRARRAYLRVWRKIREELRRVIR